MKRFPFLAGLLMITVIVKAQSDELFTPRYGISLYQASTGSGYGSSTNISLNVKKINKVFELGVLFDNKDQTFKGTEFTFKYFVAYRSGSFYRKTIMPYWYYNFIYRSPEDIIQPAGTKKYLNDENFGNKMTTLEHSLGLGAHVKLIKQFYCEGNIGFGVYLGSIYQGDKPKTWGIHRDNYGFVPSFKIGLAYLIN